MRNLPKHHTGFNLPVELDHDGLCWSSDEYLSVRPFRGSFDKKEWGEFKPSGDMAPVSKEVAENEIRNFINRFSSKEGFNDLIETQANIYYCNSIAMEFVSTCILFFGYGDYVSWEEVAEAHFEFSNTEMIALKASYEWWCNHPLLGANVYHRLDGNYSFLSHQWCVSVFYYKHPALSRSPKAKYIGEYRKV
jgi:hypothetical protein